MNEPRFEEIELYFLETDNKVKCKAQIWQFAGLTVVTAEPLKTNKLDLWNGAAAITRLETWPQERFCGQLVKSDTEYSNDQFFYKITFVRLG